jgi:hypothetical protein
MWSSLNLDATVVNVGRPPIVIRGFLIDPEGGARVITSINPLPLASGQAQRITLDLKPLLDSLAICDKISLEHESQQWKGKVSVALWFESSNVTDREQFFEIRIKEGRCILFRQMSNVEFKHLTRIQF